MPHAAASHLGLHCSLWPVWCSIQDNESSYSDLGLHCLLRHVCHSIQYHWSSDGSQKIELNILIKFSPKETICMKCQTHFSAKLKKSISKCGLQNFSLSILNSQCSFGCQSNNFVRLFFTKEEYHDNLKYWDRQAWVNSVDPDQMPQIVASDQGLHCLPLIQHHLKHINR